MRLLVLLFLLGGTAAAFGAAPLRSSADPSPAVAEFAFVHVGDTQFSASAYRGRETERGAAALREIAALQPRPAFVLHTGDLTRAGGDADFEMARKTIQEALPLPLYAAPGDQDTRWSPWGKEGFPRRFGQPRYRAFDHGGVHFLLLDSTVPLQHWGHFDREQLDWLQKDLERTGRQRPIVVAFHHPIGWRDAGQVDNDQALLDLLATYNVRLFLLGHARTDALWSLGGVPALLCHPLYDGGYHLIQVRRDGIAVSRRTPEGMRPVATIPLRRATSPAWTVTARFSGARGEVAVQRQDLPLASQVVYRLNEGPDVPLEPTAGGWRAPLPGTLAPGIHRIRTLATLPDGRTYQLSLGLSLSGPQAMAPAWRVGAAGEIQSHLSEAAGTLYVATVQGELRALDARTGQSLWSYRARSGFYGPPCLAGGTAFLGSGDGVVHAVRAADGQGLWMARPAGPVFAGVACAAGVVCVASTDRRIVGLAAQSGKTLWSVAADGAFQSRVATDGQRFFVGGWDNLLRCLDARTGALRWTRRFGQDPAQAPAVGAPAVEDGRVFVTTGDGALHALDAETGEPLWSQPDRGVGHSSPLARGGRVYCASLETGRVYCFDTVSGALWWSVAPGARFLDSSCALERGILFIGGIDGAFFGIRARDGQLLWRYRLGGGHLLASPATEAERVFVGGMEGVVQAFPLVPLYQRAEVEPKAP